MKTRETINTGLWWLSPIHVHKLQSGRWRVVGHSQPNENCKTGTERRVVYAPKTCETFQQAACWTTNSKAFYELRIHAQGCHIIAMIKDKFPDPDCRRDILGKLNSNMTAEFERGYIYKNEDAQNIIVKMLKLPMSARQPAKNFEALAVA